jgi:RNA polymerase sigma factor (sigma-70 family)
MAVMLSRATVSPECSEHDLIASAREGDDRAFEELYSRYRSRIAAFIQGRVHDHGRAEDIAQDVFMSALRRMRSSDRPIVFKPWIYEIAKNACIDEFRRTRRLHEVSLDADDGLTADSAALVSIAPGPSAAVEHRQQLDDLRGAFGGLSDNHHRLLVMREFEGLSYDEIGHRTGMSRQMVESALFRARRKLSEEYDELVSGRRCHQVQTVIEDGRAQSARALGARERRQIARHLSHCQPCRVMAHVAGADEELFQRRSLPTKIAALLPFGLWRWPWRRGAGTRLVVARTGSHPLTVTSLQSAASTADSAGPAASLGGAAIAAAVIALAGAGGAVVGGLSGHGASRPAPAVAPAGPASAGGGAGAAAHRVAPSARVIPRASALEPRSTRAARRASASGPGSSSSSGAGSGSGSGSHGSATSTAGSTAKSAGQTVQSAVHNTTGQAGSTVSKTVGGASSTVSKTVNQVTSGVSKTVSGVTSGVSKTVSGVTSGVSKTVSGVTSGVSKTVSGVTSGVSSTVGGTTSTASSAASGAVKGLSTAASSTLGATTSAVSSTLKGLA